MRFGTTVPKLVIVMMSVDRVDCGVSSTEADGLHDPVSSRYRLRRPTGRDSWFCGRDLPNDHIGKCTSGEVTHERHVGQKKRVRATIHCL
jgi:hypothetical protein